MKQVKDGFAAHVGSSDYIVLATRVARGNRLRSCHSDRLGRPHQFIRSDFSFHTVCCHVGLHNIHRLISVPKLLTYFYFNNNYDNYYYFFTYPMW